MKKFISILLAMALMINLIPVSVSAKEKERDSSSKIMHMKFDDNFVEEVSGQTMTDYGDIRFEGGKSESAIYLDGDGDYIELGNEYNLPGDFSFNVWVKPDSADRSDAALFAKYETNSYGPYDFYLSYNRPAFWVSDGDGGNEEYISETTLFSDRWYMLTYVYDQALAELTIYINGKYDSSYGCSALTQNEDVVTIGRQALMFDPYKNLEYKGYLDEMSIYGTALSADEISDMYMELGGTYEEEPDEDAWPTYPEDGQEVWVIFNEGYRDDRVELTTCDVEGNPEDMYITWDRGLYLSNGNASGDYNQYYLNGNREWEKIGTYHLFTDYATKVYASNLDIYDTSGNLILKKTDKYALKNDIDVDTDTWEFKNFSGCGKKYWTFWYPELQAKELNDLVNQAKGGVCYGMVMSAIALNSKEQSPSDFNADMVEDIKRKDASESMGITAEEYIRYMFPIQISQGVQDAYRNDLNGLYQAVKDFETGKNDGVEIGVFGWYLFEDHAGHSLWGIRTIDGKDECKIQVYDCNHPNEERYITLKKDAEGNFVSWTYDPDLLGAATFGTGQKGNPEIQYIDWIGTYYDIIRKKLLGIEEEYPEGITDLPLVALGEGKLKNEENLTEISFTNLIEKDEAEAENPEQKKLYWCKDDNLQVLDAGNGIHASLIGTDTSVEVLAESGKKATLAIGDKTSDSVDVQTEEGERVAITFSKTEENDSVTSRLIEGEATGTIVKSSESNGENVIAGLSEVMIVDTNVLEDEDGNEISNTEEKVYAENLNPESDYLISLDEDDEKIVVSEDTDGDGTFETVVPVLENVQISCSLSKEKLVYNEEQQTPEVIVEDEYGNILTEGEDYVLEYAQTSRAAVGRYSVTVIPKKNYVGKETLTYTIVPRETSKLSAIRYQYGNKIRLSWPEAEGATGYRISWKKPGTSSYKYLASTEKLYYTKSSLIKNKTYYFKVTPYYEEDGVKYYGTSKDAYRTISIKTVKAGKKLVQVKKPTLSVSGKKVKVKWKNIKNESGYQISRSTSSKGTNIVSTYTTTKGTSKTVTAKKGVKYYYKVRAFRTVDGKKIYGQWSAVKSYTRK